MRGVGDAGTDHDRCELAPDSSLDPVAEGTTLGIARRIAQVLSPHLGDQTADDVARYLCARHGIVGEPIDPGVVGALQETIRKGLLAFVDPALAHELARRCL